MRERRERKRYKWTSLVKFPIEEGISPVNWLLSRYLIEIEREERKKEIQILKIVQIPNRRRD